MEEILNKHFGDERIMYYNPGDNIHASHYLRYRKDGGVVLSVGSDDGEVELLKTSDPERLSQLIEALIK